MDFQLITIERIEHAIVFFHLCDSELLYAVGELGVSWSPPPCSAAEDKQCLAFTTRNLCLQLIVIALCFGSIFPFPAAVKNGNDIHV